MRIQPILYFMIIAFVVFSCSSQKQEKKVVDRKNLEESLMQANKRLLKEEAGDINDFIKRKGWKMQESGSGLRYMIYEKGSGPSVEKGDVVKFDYTMMLMSGDTIESSSEKGYMSFAAGRGDAIQALHEAALLMREGDMARLVVPSHLGYGLTGLPHKVPPKAVLVYDIKLNKVNK